MTVEKKRYSRPSHHAKPAKIIRVEVYEPDRTLIKTFHYNMNNEEQSREARRTIVKFMLADKVIVSGNKEVMGDDCA